MATNPCCDIHFTCVNCPIITGPDCVPPNNLLPGQLWYNPCTCTYYFDCPQLDDETNSCETLTPLNYKPGAGISMAGDCENGHFISVKIEPQTGLGFTGLGELTIDCANLINHCQLWTRENLLFNTEDFALVCDVNGICTLQLNPDTPNVRSRNAGEVASAGVCISASPTVFAGPIPDAQNAILQMRDLTWILGNGTYIPGPTGAYLTETFTNNWSTPALLEVDLICQDNFLATLAGVLTYDQQVGFIHGITEVLAVQPPSFGAGNDPALPNWAFNQVSSGTPWFNPTPGGGLGQAGYSPQTAVCKFTKVMAPGQTVTLYYQWWAVFNEIYAASADTYVLHGGMATASKMSRNVIPL
jgi:hypothetical protein